jgi:hypothetical protein
VCLQVSVGEASHARGRVHFVRFHGNKVVVVEWWLSKDFLEPGASRLDIGYVREGFSYGVGEVMRNHEVDDVGMENDTGFRLLSSSRYCHHKADRACLGNGCSVV